MEAEQDFKDKVKLLHKLHPKLDILMCETLLRTPEERLEELYEKYKNNYPTTEGAKEEQVLQEITLSDGRVVPAITIEHFDYDPHAPQNSPRSITETPFN